MLVQYGSHPGQPNGAAAVNGRGAVLPLAAAGAKAAAAAHAPEPPRYAAVKAVLEWGAALCLLVVAAPVILVAALAVRLTSRGPAFYTQLRLGRHGRPFRIYKLRTMVYDCERLTGPCWALPGDPRITRVGAVLRRTHLDELPQLVNVLCGHMGLIGPRPERPEFLPRLEEALPSYRRRLAVRPGVTGLAQVQLPPDTDLASVRRKLAYDLYYIAHVGPWLDLQILFCTACHVLGVPVRVARWLFRVPPGETIERAVPVPVRGEAAELALSAGVA